MINSCSHQAFKMQKTSIIAKISIWNLFQFQFLVKEPIMTVVKISLRLICQKAIKKLFESGKNTNKGTTQFLTSYSQECLKVKSNAEPVSQILKPMTHLLC